MGTYDAATTDVLAINEAMSPEEEEALMWDLFWQEEEALQELARRQAEDELEVAARNASPGTS